MSNGDEVEAIASSHLRPMRFFWELLPKCCDTHARHMALVHHANCRTFPRGVPGFFANSCGNVAAETHVKSAEDLRGGLENLNNFSLLSELAPTVESIM
jgi:hypothetical protein